MQTYLVHIFFCSDISINIALKNINVIHGQHKTFLLYANL